ncbi:class I SAM-dependent methyltransferase [Marinobacter changyiensis]|uniref:class I SAM-dependent methyltransferase n=1 Tax=Marinobacter changyiensis TaxID=2604091 RepID=UPI0012649341|nr:class I SAM-dependent methyltransferase [Marinobacter changyiensis]
MSTLSNAYEALLRNRHLVTGRPVLVGIRDANLLNHWPDGGLAITDHFGVFEQLQQVANWQSVFGTPANGPVSDPCNTAVVFLPKAREELTFRLRLAASLLKPGGHLLLIGEKREGIAGAVKQLKAIAPESEKMDSARHCQVWLGKPDQADTDFDEAAWVSWHTVDSAGISLEVAGLPGIFSDGRLDEGTALLLASLDTVAPRGPVLDFACGAGVMGAWLQKRWGLAVDGVDVQAQAVTCAGLTYDRAKVSGVILPSDGLNGVTGRYQTIITNPPFHSGVATDTSMTEDFLKQAAKHLNPGGELRLVANGFLPYPRLIKQYIGNCRVLMKTPRFSVYSANRH